MAEPGSMAKSNAETKQKIESKPIVEKTSEENQSKGRSSRLWVLIGVLALVLIAVSTAFIALPYNTKNAGTALWTKVTGSGHKREEVKAMLSLEPFLVNLADTNEVRFVKTTFQLGLAEEPGEEMKSGAAIAAIRDSIITLLTSKQAEQILTPEGKDALRHEIRSRVNAISPETRVLEVYIVDFVVQL